MLGVLSPDAEDDTGFALAAARSAKTKGLLIIENYQYFVKCGKINLSADGARQDAWGQVAAVSAVPSRCYKRKAPRRRSVSRPCRIPGLQHSTDGMQRVATRALVARRRIIKALALPRSPLPSSGQQLDSVRTFALR